jgi:hypothetical protein
LISISAPFQMMPGLQMMPHMMPRPLFPSAVVTSAQQQKTTFPAYNSTATISAPPTVGNSNASSTSSSDPQRNVAASASAPSQGSMKIMHPAEDLSLEEIRARKQQYKMKINNQNHPNSRLHAPMVTKSPDTRSLHSEVSAYLILIDFWRNFA